MRTKQETEDMLIREYMKAIKSIGLLKDADKPYMKPYAEGYAEGLLTALAVMKEMSIHEAQDYAVKAYVDMAGGLDL